MLWFRGQSASMKKWSYQQKMENCMKLKNELTEMYELVNKMFIICLDRGLRLIMENPYSEEHYLRRYWCYPPSVIDRDRRERGDYFKKPTQYFFVNCKPSNNLIFEINNDNSIKIKDAIRFMPNGKYVGADNLKTARSMIHPQYANRFIREFIIENS
jgi:hypothetical protein